MANLSAKNISKTYVVEPVLEGVTLHLVPGEKVALVGENGAGKSTLLRILAGAEEVSSGLVEMKEGVRRHYASQDFSEDESRTVEEYFKEDSRVPMHRVFAYLHELEIPHDILGKRIEVLSGGQKKLIQLVRALLSGAQFLFLDEPENHLDYFAREWLAGKMSDYYGALVFVSHDEYVVDRVAEKIVEVEDGKTKEYRGTFAFYLEEKERQKEAEHQDWLEEEREIARHREMVQRMQGYAHHNSGRARMYQERKKKLERMLEERKEEPTMDRKKMKLRTADVERKSTKRIALIDGVTYEIGGKHLFYKADASLFFGEKVCLFGRNGSGKTTLVKMLRGEIAPQEGELSLGTNMAVGYFSQDHDDGVDAAKTPMDAILPHVRHNEERARALLGRFLIDEEAAERPVSSLSGGQKVRLRFALLFSRDVEFLLLDEPTNNLDPVSWQILADAVAEFNGSVLLITHDRAFADMTTNKLWVLEQGKIREFLGNFSEFVERQK